VNNIVSESSELYRVRKLMKKNLGKYSSVKVISVMNIIGNLLDMKEPSTKTTAFPHSEEPIALRTDNMLPICIDLDKDN